MKKQLLTLAVLCAVAFASNAQTEKGDNLIGGSIAYSKDKQTPENLYTSNSIESTNFAITPRFGHFISNNMAIGLSIRYVRSKNFYGYNFNTGTGTLINNSENKNESFDFGPFMRYYVNIIDKFKFFGQGNVSIAFGKSVAQNNGSSTFLSQSTKYKTTSYTAAINPGFAFFPTKRWAIELSFPLLSYNKYNLKDDGVNQNSQAYESDGFRFGLDSFNPSLGVNFHF